MPLLPWQRWLAIHGLELLPDGRPRFRTVLVLVARQNGKTSLLKVLALFWLYVQAVELVLGTSTKLDYARESWEGAVALARACPDLDELILPGASGVRRANGEQTLTVRGPLGRQHRYKIAAANADAGRSLTVGRLILDELRQHKTWAAWAAATKAGMAVPDFQTWAITNAGDVKSVVLNTLRAKALAQMAAGTPIDLGAPAADDVTAAGGTIGLFEWSAPEGCPIDDRTGWAQANPSLGYGTITEEAIAEAMGTDPEPLFRTEVLCQTVAALKPLPIPLDTWAALGDEESTFPDGQHVLAFEVSLGSRWTTVALAGRREDGRCQLEVLKRAPGTRWVPEFLATVATQNGGAAGVFANDYPTNKALVPDLEAAGLTPDGVGVGVTLVNKAEFARACSWLESAVKDGDVVHLDDPDLNDSLANAAKADTGDGGWVWTRRRSEGDIDAIVAATVAADGLRVVPEPNTPVPSFSWGGDHDDHDDEERW